MRRGQILILVFIGVWFMGCRQAPIPKPYSYFRIDTPQHTYRPFNEQGYPYHFDVSTITRVEKHPLHNEPFWVDIQYPVWNAKIHCTYKRIHSRNDLRTYSDECQQFVYNHLSKANAIPEREYGNDSLRVWGLFYELKGNTASPIQLYVTDSTTHFFRGAVYIEALPNADSLAPIIDYLKTDAIHLVETFKWQ